MRLLKVGLGLLLLLLGAASTVAEEPGNVILDQFGSWRMFHVLKAPEIAFDDGARPITYPQAYYLNGSTPEPPAGWMKPEFDDADWLRGPVGMGCRAPFTARACLRGKFRVLDPSQVKTLQLALGFHGGATIYLNGEEIGRGNLAPGAALAEAYPLDAFVNAEGKIMGSGGKAARRDKKDAAAGMSDAEAARRIGLRARSLEIALPTRLLRKGVNVLAIEVVRAPYHKVVHEQKGHRWDGDLYSLLWNACELKEARLTLSGSGGEPNVARPAGLQVWNSPSLRTDFAPDFGDPCETLRPVVLCGARNGAFSEKVVLGSTKPIRGLKASLDGLRGAGGSIPASAIQLRYAAAGNIEFGIYNDIFGFGKPTDHAYTWGMSAAQRAQHAPALISLLDAPPAEYAVMRAAAPHVVGPSRDVFGALAPVWFTIRVPADAKAGNYEGKLVLSCEGEKPVEVPVRLEVADWTLPSPDAYRTWVEMIQSPDTLQLEYGVPAWSDKHFELIARSFRIIRETGSRVLHVPLLCCTHYGNEESIVRWIKKGENDYDFDFSVMDRYLDVAEKNLGRPKLVCFIVWELFLAPKANRRADEAKNRMSEFHVSVLDPTTGAVERMPLPNYSTDPATKANLLKLFGQLRERMRKRGLEEAMMLGWFNDIRASRAEMDFWKDVSGDLPWVSHSHYKTTTHTPADKLGFKTGYMTALHDVEFSKDPAKQRSYGWLNPVLLAQQYIRVSGRSEMQMLPGSMWQGLSEVNITGKQRGFGRLGGDYWPAVKDKKGQRVGWPHERYPWSAWGMLEMQTSVLAPGPEGAVATSRFEQFREGVQQCEARIAIESALIDKVKREKLGEDLASRCQAALDERLAYGLRGVSQFRSGATWQWWYETGETGHAWFQSTNPQQRNAKLFALASEVGKKLAAK